MSCDHCARGRCVYPICQRVMTKPRIAGRSMPLPVLRYVYAEHQWQLVVRWHGGLTTERLGDNQLRALTSKPTVLRLA